MARKTTAKDVTAAKLRADLAAEKNRYDMERARGRAIRRVGKIAEDAARNLNERWRRARGDDADSGVTGPMAFSGSFRSSRTSRTRVPLGSGGWGGRVQVGSPDAQLDESTLAHGRSDAIDLYRNSYVAKMVIGRKVDMHVGDGSTLTPKTSSAEFNEQLKKYWSAYWTRKGVDPETGVRGVDARGMVAGPAFERLVKQQVYSDGDLAVIPLANGTLAVIAGERVTSRHGVGSALEEDWTKGRGGETAGVLLDGAGAVRGIRVADYGRGGAGLDHPTRVIPGDLVMWLMNARGRSGGINQTRGEPLLLCVYDLILELDRYIAATGIGAYVAACLTAVVKSTSPAQMQAALAGETVTVTNGDGSTSQQRRQVFEPGGVWHIGTNEEVGSITPNQPTGNFQPFVHAVLGLIFAYAGMPKLAGMFDPTGVNLSLMRGLVQLAGVENRAEQEDWKTGFLSPAYVNRVAMWIREGKLKNPPADWAAHEWTCEPLPVLDFMGELQAWSMAVDKGFGTREMATTSMWGKTAKEIVDARVLEQKYEDERGLRTATVPGQQVREAAANGQGPAKPEDPANPDEG